ncbi:hypothetical protein QUF72_14700 [Desulfobacterales bacterium HSG2]|nr:hypothetical protein [Desulfobacterales bacterium HSG2]
MAIRAERTGIAERTVPVNWNRGVWLGFSRTGTVEHGSDLAIRAERTGWRGDWNRGVWLGFSNPSRADWMPSGLNLWSLARI